MVNQEILEEYSQTIKRLKKYSVNAGISEDEFKKLYFATLNSTELRRKRHKYYKYSCIILAILTVIFVGCLYRSMFSNLICNLEDYIYPGLRLIRKISILFISLFPALTDLYQEPCLIHNPFFTVVDMDCWPCSSVNNVRQVHNPHLVNQQHSAPFIYETDQDVIKVEHIREIYMKNKNMFDNDAEKVSVNGKFHLTPREIFETPLKGDKNLYVWRLTNFNIARILRHLIRRPKVVPKYGQSTERFIIIDSSQQSFNVPDTECNYSFILSLSGTRTVQLRPAEECKHQCKSLQVELKDSHLLWYNWWYYRPVVQSSNGNSTFVAHVGSYC